MHLTEQQLAIVQHDHGPALVFAVAGAGKTTTMVYRIARLVQEARFAPHHILATTFNRSAAQELQSRLEPWPACADVDVRTLHSLGGQIVAVAQRRGYLPQLKAQAFKQVDSATDIVLNKALATARRRKTSYVEELNQLDRQHFLTTLGIWKGQLAYPDLAHAALPAAARRVATQAQAPATRPWYLAFYRLYEEVRAAEGLLTFDDQLMTGWEMLVRHPALLAEFQTRYRCVLVDEFQDINLAQAELLDLLTAPHRNYMVIGDDDQTIYEWRGANPRFILDFERRYRAKVYYMTENFRCKAGPLVLANRVIRHNQQRRAKQLQLTQGFGGVTTVQGHATAERMGQAIAQQVQQAQAQGYGLNQIAVLVRVYAQTPSVEQALMALGLPYVVEGDAPFYRRSEVQTLIDYCRLAYFERLLLAHTALSEEQWTQWESSWRQIYWQPKRYIARDLAQQLVTHVRTTQRPLSEALRHFSAEVRPSIAEKMTQLAEDLLWLAQALPPGPRAQTPAAQILTQLEQRLNFRNYLEAEHGSAESGMAKADTVTAFLEYAQGKGTLMHFLQNLRQLSLSGDEPAADVAGPRVTLTTIFRAKGREWPIVILPHCNEGFLPYKTAHNLEEERRLLYVALTRTQQDLYLHHITEAKVSSFLEEAQHTALLKGVQLLATLLHKAPAQWNASEVAAVAAYTQQLQLQGYFQQWSPWDRATQQQVATMMAGLSTVVTERKLFRRLRLPTNFAEFWRSLWPSRAAQLPAPVPTVRAQPVRHPLSSPQRPHSTATTAEQVPVAAPPAVRWHEGMSVHHSTLGRGVIVSVLDTLTPAVLSVRFDDSGATKRFLADTDQLAVE